MDFIPFQHDGVLSHLVCMRHRNLVKPGNLCFGDLGHDTPLTVSDIILEVGETLVSVLCPQMGSKRVLKYALGWLKLGEKHYILSDPTR